MLAQNADDVRGQIVSAKVWIKPTVRLRAIRIGKEIHYAVLVRDAVIKSINFVKQSGAKLNEFASAIVDPVAMLFRTLHNVFLLI